MALPPRQQLQQAPLGAPPRTPPRQFVRSAGQPPSARSGGAPHPDSGMAASGPPGMSSSPAMQHVTAGGSMPKLNAAPAPTHPMLELSPQELLWRDILKQQEAGSQQMGAIYDQAQQRYGGIAGAAGIGGMGAQTGAAMGMEKAQEKQLYDQRGFEMKMTYLQRLKEQAIAEGRRKNALDIQDMIDETTKGIARVEGERKLQDQKAAFLLSRNQTEQEYNNQRNFYTRLATAGIPRKAIDAYWNAGFRDASLVLPEQDQKTE